MNRSPLIAGNWKQHKTEREAIALARKILLGTRHIEGVDILLCPPYTALSTLHKLLISSPLFLGSQNMSAHRGGAYTGEISARMIAEFCTHVILGHSERRSLFGETDQLINQKIQLAFAAGLTPILCVGERLPEREAGQTLPVVQRQLREGLNQVPLSGDAQLIIAYEPVWAIGTGRSASPQEAAHVIRHGIRSTIQDLWGKKRAQSIRVLYGGSVKPGNALPFINEVEIDGALVGGASLDSDSFIQIIEAARP
jgi:triosephosphate isomerase